MTIKNKEWTRWVKKQCNIIIRITRRPNNYCTRTKSNASINIYMYKKMYAVCIGNIYVCLQWPDSDIAFDSCHQDKTTWNKNLKRKNVIKMLYLHFLFWVQKELFVHYIFIKFIAKAFEIIHKKKLFIVINMSTHLNITSTQQQKTTGHILSSSLN